MDPDAYMEITLFAVALPDKSASSDYSPSKSNSYRANGDTTGADSGVENADRFISKLM